VPHDAVAVSVARGELREHGVIAQLDLDRGAEEFAVRAGDHGGGVAPLAAIRPLFDLLGEAAMIDRDAVLLLDPVLRRAAGGVVWSSALFLVAWVRCTSQMTRSDSRRQPSR